jgi:type VI secretion system VasD/TssJ family lipoprotein
MNDRWIRLVRTRSSRLAALAAAVCLTAALAVPAAAKETKLRSEVVAAENINPSRRGTPQPVKLHIFYLAKADKFGQANFADLVVPDAPSLGPELVRHAEHLVGPGETLALDEQFDEAAKFIGVIAEFTELDQASWRAVAAVPARRWTDVLKLFKNSKLQILVDGTTVTCAIVED